MSPIIQKFGPVLFCYSERTLEGSREQRLASALVPFWCPPTPILLQGGGRNCHWLRWLFWYYNTREAVQSASVCLSFKGIGKLERYPGNELLNIGEEGPLRHLTAWGSRGSAPFMNSSSTWAQMIRIRFSGGIVVEWQDKKDVLGRLRYAVAN
ncbi:hypothetical protein V2G26_010120 [Clonostachys chloroleuca]